ncbi:aldehyde reductase, putative [Aspergillus fumigatus Z5]|nr:aldehyde reductase, putative [Aspergillus fumigatus Z5]
MARGPRSEIARRPASVQPDEATPGPIEAEAPLDRASLALPWKKKQQLGAKHQLDEAGAKSLVLQDENASAGYTSYNEYVHRLAEVSLNDRTEGYWVQQTASCCLIERMKK